MTDKGKERIQRNCFHVDLERLKREDGSYSEFSKCKRCPAVFLTNHPLGGVMATAPKSLQQSI